MNPLKHILRNLHTVRLQLQSLTDDPPTLVALHQHTSALETLARASASLPKSPRTLRKQGAKTSNSVVNQRLNTRGDSLNALKGRAIHRQLAGLGAEELWDLRCQLFVLRQSGWLAQRKGRKTAADFVLGKLCSAQELAVKGVFEGPRHEMPVVKCPQIRGKKGGLEGAIDWWVDCQAV